MKTKEMTLVEFSERFNRGDFASYTTQTQIDAGWYDWFCKSNELRDKTYKLAPKVLEIMDSPKLDKNKTYVFFKNNCPCVGPLYDQFSICDIETGEVLFCCQYLNRGSHGCKTAHWDIYSADYSWREPVVSGTWSKCKKWFYED